MSKAGSAAKIKLNSYEDLFGGSSAQDAGEQIINAPLADIYNFKDHPFKVLDDEKMEETTESIRLYGVLVPGIARPRAGGGYELISGHRRKRGSERAGKADSIDVMDETDAYMELIRENLEYEHHMKYEQYGDRELYEEIYETVCDVVCVKRRTIRINGEDYPYELVKLTRPPP